MRKLLDTPTASEVLIPAAVYATLAGISFYASKDLGRDANPKLVEALSNNLALLLAFGVGFSVYWLNRKEQRLGRAFLLTLVSVTGAAILGALVLQVANPALFTLPAVTLVTVAIFVVLWVITSFFR
jgi:uncharacterized membrane protein YfcA